MNGLTIHLFTLFCKTVSYTDVVHNWSKKSKWFDETEKAYTNALTKY